MNNNNKFVRDLANSLISIGKKMTNKNLADELNKAGLKTSYGTLYEGERGTFNLISSTYHKLDKLGMTKDKDNVANAFTNSKGEHPYL
jgi:hypothetical protein